MPGTNLTVPSNSIMSSANIVLTQDHLIKSAIAVEEDVLTSELKKERKVLDQILTEIRAKQTEHKNEIDRLSKEVVAKISKKIVPTMKKLGFKQDFSMRFQTNYFTDEDDVNKTKKNQLQIYLNAKDSGSIFFQNVSEPTSKKSVKCLQDIKELEVKQTKSQTRIELIMSELADLSKKERRAVAMMTLQQLGENSDAGQQFKVMMDEVRAKTAERIA